MEYPKVTSDELDLDDDGLRACYKEQGLFDNVGVDVRLKILPEVEDGEGNMVPYARLSIDLTVDLTEGPDHWSIGWTNYLYYLQGDLKPYLDRYCPYPQEVWAVCQRLFDNEGKPYFKDQLDALSSQ
jgi:hypothetical protein